MLSPSPPEVKIIHNPEKAHFPALVSTGKKGKAEINV